MRSVRHLVFLAVAVLAFAPCPVYAGDVAPSPNDPTSGELVQSSARWDGKRITYTGEVVLEAQERGDHAWIHVNDDAYYLKNVEEGATLGGYNSGHAIWLPLEQAEKIEYFGDHAHEGDVVTVQGVFNAACAEHGGDTDIHADVLEVVIPGRLAEDPVRTWKLLLALGLSLGAGGAWGLHRRETHRRRRGPRSG